MTGAAAQEFNIGVHGRLLLMELAGHAVSIPGPLWTLGETVEVERSNVRFNRLEPGAESLVLSPQSESSINWTRIMGVHAVNRPGFSGADHVRSIVEPVRQSCSRDQIATSTLEAVEENGLSALLVLCGRYLPTARSRPRNCTGGILVAVVLESERGAMTVYNEWCTRAFDVINGDDWPVASDQLLAIASELQTATRFVPVPQPEAEQPH